MRLIALCLVCFLAGCELNPGNVTQSGVGTETIKSNRSAREMVGCITPLFDDIGGQITNRITANGYEIIENSGYVNAYVFRTISIDETADGSVTTGHIAADLPWRQTRIRQMRKIIIECAEAE